ncbi:MAG: DUF2267 domain-containing protein [Devosia sp.]|nr:DUF2267 domain-containing protein [Devosia sp.]
MSANGLEVFDRTLHISNIWLGEIMERIGCDRHAAWHVLGTVLHAIRDRIPEGLAAHLGAQLPLLIRGLYYDQWRAGQELRKWRSLDEFTGVIGADFRGIETVDAVAAARAVFQVLNHHVDPGQVGNVRAAMPEEVRALWPENGPATGRRLDSAA